MIMIDTQLGCELARAYQQYRSARFVCRETKDGPVGIHRFWERQRRQKRTEFTRLAEKLADQLIEEKFNDMEIGP